MVDWQKLYDDGTFKITTAEPSGIVKLGLEMVKPNRVVDLGCGSGRNSIYAASLGHIVDSVDIADLNFLEHLTPEIKDRITFHRTSVTDFDIKSSSYAGIIMARLIQYIDPTSLITLFQRSADGLQQHGVLMLNYTASGGLFGNKEMDVERHQHSIEDVIYMLDRASLTLVHLQKGAPTTVHTNYNLEVESYDLIVKKE